MKSQGDPQLERERNDSWDELAKEIRKLAVNGATNQDICEVFKIGESELEMRFGALLVEARASRRVLIRGKQTDVAIKGGNAAMLSLLGKNELGQGRASTAGETHRPEPDLEPKVG